VGCQRGSRPRWAMRRGPEPDAQQPGGGNVQAVLRWWSGSHPMLARRRPAPQHGQSRGSSGCHQTTWCSRRSRWRRCSATASPSRPCVPSARRARCLEPSKQGAVGAWPAGASALSCQLRVMHPLAQPEARRRRRSWVRRPIHRGRAEQLTIIAGRGSELPDHPKWSASELAFANSCADVRGVARWRSSTSCRGFIRTRREVP